MCFVFKSILLFITAACRPFIPITVIIPPGLCSLINAGKKSYRYIICIKYIFFNNIIDLRFIIFPLLFTRCQAVTSILSPVRCNHHHIRPTSAMGIIISLFIIIHRTVAIISHKFMIIILHNKLTFKLYTPLIDSTRIKQKINRDKPCLLYIHYIKKYLLFFYRAFKQCQTQNTDQHSQRINCAKIHSISSYIKGRLFHKSNYKCSEYRHKSHTQ